MRFPRLIELLLITCGASVSSFPASAAQTGSSAAGYPNKPVRWIVDFPAGGLSDTIARTVGAKLQESLGQPFVVDPRPGAGGLVAYGLGAKATADGYTISIVSAPFSVNLNLYEKLPYDTFRDFAPISLMATAPNVLVTGPTIPVKTVQELIAYAKSRPGGANFGSVGNGSSPHLTGELFKTRAALNATHVPFNGSGPALNDLMAGRVDFMFVNYPAARPLARAGRLQILASADDKRLRAFPDVPTIAESGFPGFRSTTWVGSAAPAGTPERIIDTLNREMVRILKLEDVRERLDLLGFEARGSTPGEFRAFLKEEVKRWQRVIKDAGIKPRKS